ncbi:hypothetical protein Daura_19510 [Dactylosporangium aurantiacum]|uniref:Secreted protein n=1 Tax=Dactylosporangium aurantiacum TaxID=35754 RepID=A0A9Q9IQU9_9ACTN|nr:hypothetical protein [Dactylosporangium aurantiacum]MDG6106349.1 hypothetical protein [Dactylosporangium aurantiacum]UWZ58162.1 hypothetical protein Daura_19510 [Dactylosporangium aurantiacum]
MGHAIARKGIVTLVAVCGIAALTPATPAAAADAAPVPFGQATKIVLDRSGGFAGERTSFVVDRTTVGGRPALRMAGSWKFRWLRSSYQPRNPCCDRYAYRVTVTYRGGFRKTVRTVQGTQAPRILWDVITETERVGVRPFSPAPAG